MDRDGQNKGLKQDMRGKHVGGETAQDVYMIQTERTREETRESEEHVYITEEKKEEKGEKWG